MTEQKNIENHKTFIGFLSKVVQGSFNIEYLLVTKIKVRLQFFLAPLLVSPTERGEKIGLDQEKRSLFNPLILHKISLLIL